MPPKQMKESLIFIINVGTSAIGEPRNTVILDKAKLITKCLIERKIFLRPKDEIGVILMGSELTTNNLNFPNIQELCNVLVPEWDLVECVMNLEGTSCASNWVDAIYVALDYIKRECVDSSTRKIVLLSDYKEESDVMTQFNPNEIANALASEDIQLLSIGEKSIDEKPEAALSASEKVLMEVCQQVGEYLTFDSAIQDVRFYKGVPVKPMGWTCNLELVGINIPITAYVKVSDDCKLPTWKSVVNKNSDGEEVDINNDLKVKTVTEYIDKERAAVSKDETVPAYMYGGTPIPFSEEDTAAMVYKSGSKSYKIHSFSPREEVGIENWCKCNTRIVVPANEFAAEPFYCLVRAMVNEDVVAIVRKVYGNDKAPRMVGLFPRIEVAGEPWCLVEIELPFAEDKRSIQPTSLNSIMKDVTTEQEQTVENLLNSLMVPDREEGDTDEDTSMTYLPGCVHNPATQHTWNMLAYRALHPGKPLPPMEEHLRKALEPLEQIKERSKVHFEKLEELFDLNDPELSETNKSEAELTYSPQNENKTETVDQVNEDINISGESNVSMDPLDTSDVDFDELAGNMQ